MNEFEMILNENNIENRIELLDKYQDKLNSFQAVWVIKSISEERRAELLDKYQDKLESSALGDLIKSMPKEQKADMLVKYQDKLDSSNIAEIISQLPEEQRFSALDYCQNKLKSSDLKNLTQYFTKEQKVDFVVRYQDKLDSYIIKSVIDKMPIEQKADIIVDCQNKLDLSDISNLISNLPEDKKANTLVRCQYVLESSTIYDMIVNLPEEQRMNTFEKYKNELNISALNGIIPTFTEEKRIEILEKYKDELDVNKLVNISGHVSSDKRDMFLDKIKERIGTEKLNYLKEMSEKNEEVYNRINLEMLEEKYINALGIDKINLVSCFPDVQKNILSLSDKELTFFVRSIEDFADRTNSEEWTNVATRWLDNISSYSELIENIDIEKCDITKLSKIMQTKNVFEIKSNEDIENFEDIKRQKLDEWIKSDDLENKKLAVYEKCFGHDLEFANEIIGKFGEGVKDLPDSPLKEYVGIVEKIKLKEDPKKLEEVFSECKENNFVGLEETIRGLKTEFCKEYNKDLFDVSKGKHVIENVYEAGTDFKMLIHSVSAYTEEKVVNYKESWNRPAIASQHLCASYIRNDMIATAPISEVCYGFSNLKDDALMLSGARDLCSSDTGFESKAMRNEKYFCPDEEINRTEFHNELDIRRMDGERKKQPDYIVVFRSDGEIQNIDNALKAQEEWENLPIVIVDKDKCLESEKQKVDQMLEEYKTNPSEELKKNIYQKLRNNRQTSDKFMSDIDIENFRTENDIQKENNLEVNDVEKVVENLNKNEFEKSAEEINYNELEKELQEQEPVITSSVESQENDIIGKEERNKLLKSAIEATKLTVRSSDTEREEKEVHHIKEALKKAESKDLGWEDYF